MNYVLLVNKEVGLANGAYPVCGKSMRVYGHASIDTVRGGVAFKMSIEDYEAAKFDIIGNRSFQQIWVPEFVDEPAIQEVIEINQAGKVLPPFTEPNLDDMKWKELTELGRAHGVFKVGQKRAELIELIRQKGRKAA